MGTDEGRMYLDGLALVWKCPNCSEEHLQPFDRDSYFYDCVEFNKEDIVTIYCNECDSEFELNFKINVNVEIMGELEEVDED